MTPEKIPPPDIMHFIFDAKLTTRVVTKANDQGDTLTLTTSTQKGLLFLGILWIYPPPSNSGKWRFIGIPY